MQNKNNDNNLMNSNFLTSREHMQTTKKYLIYYYFAS